MILFFQAAWLATSTTLSPLHELVTRTIFHPIRWSPLVAWMSLTAGLFRFNLNCLQHLKIYLNGTTLTFRLVSLYSDEAALSEFSSGRWQKFHSLNWFHWSSLVYFAILWTWLWLFTIYTLWTNDWRKVFRPCIVIIIITVAVVTQYSFLPLRR